MIFLAVSYDSRLLLSLSRDTAGGDDVLAFGWLPARKRMRGFIRRASITYQLSYAYLCIFAYSSQDCYECTCNTVIKGVTRGIVELEAVRRRVTARRNARKTSAIKYAYNDIVIEIINKRIRKHLNTYYSIGTENSWIRNFLKY